MNDSKPKMSRMPMNPPAAFVCAVPLPLGSMSALIRETSQLKLRP